MKLNKKKMLLLSLVILVIMAAGTTLAFLIIGTDDVENKFTPSEVSCTVTEDPFDNKIKSNVKITNTSDIPAFIRAEVVATWEDANGNKYAGGPVEGVDYIVKYGGNEGKLEGSGWLKGADGYFYYTGCVAANNGTTSVLIDECVPVDENTPKGYFLSVEIIASAIQADGGSIVDGSWKSAAEQAWSSDKVTVTIGENGELVVEPVATN